MSTLRKAFTIVEAVVSNQARGMTFAEIVAATGTPKASTHRILKELVALGMFNFTPETSRYRGSLKLAGLGSEVTVNFDLRTLVRPHLQKMHDETRHTANLAVLDGDQGVYVDKIEATDYGIRLFSAVGRRFPLYCTGLGKSLLAHQPAEMRKRILTPPLDAATTKTVTEPELIEQELAQVREQGYSLDREEITRGVVCVAAPIFGSPDNVIGAVSIAFPSYIDSDRGIEPEIAAIKLYASKISGALTKG
jgi:DNA-binding IclR family transcriptional regulator